MTKDATLIAGELADIAAGFDRLAAALAEIRPEINIPAPVVNVAAPVVNVEVPPAAPPLVNVAAPVVNVQPYKPVAYVVRVTERDMDGLISAFLITPT